MSERKTDKFTIFVMFTHDGKVVYRILQRRRKYGFPRNRITTGSENTLRDIFSAPMSQKLASLLEAA